jgi:hypothetical protein
MSASDFDMAIERQPDPKGDHIRCIVIIPGRGQAANPEPMNTASGRTRKNRCAQLSRPVFMGSGPVPPGHPGMTTPTGRDPMDVIDD